MTDKLSETEREELDLLLPWYAAGTLDADDHARVDAALKTDEALARSLALVHDDLNAAVSVAETEPVPTSAEVRFLAQLDQEIDRTRRVQAEPASPASDGLLARAAAWISGTVFGGAPHNMALAAAAMVMVIAIQAGVIGTLVGTGEDVEPGFVTASGEAQTPALSGSVFLVRFAVGTDMTALSAFLAEEGARLADGPLDGGFFKVRFDAEDARDDDALAAALRERPELFQMVLPSQ